VLLAMAAVLDVPALRFVAVAFLLGGILAREAWMWRGERRTALVMLAFILGVIVVAFAVQRLSA
jgi:hypothetical protein